MADGVAMTEVAGLRVLVTGATGRIGSVVTRLLNDLGARVTTLSVNVNPALEADRVLQGDTTSEADVATAIDGVDAVLHLAALAHRDMDTPYNVYSTNVVSTFNVLAQAGARGITRAVVASSINAYGVPMNHHGVTPAYFPLDTQMPVDIDDWYSLSKLNGEQIASMAWRHWGIDVISLRLPRVDGEAQLRATSERLTENPAQGMREGWSYLDTRDAARALVSALTAPVTGAHAVLLAADHTVVPYRTDELLRVFAPNTPRVRPFVGHEVPIDLSAARTLLGFRAEYELDLPTLPLDR